MGMNEELTEQDLEWAKATDIEQSVIWANEANEWLIVILQEYSRIGQIFDSGHEIQAFLMTVCFTLLLIGVLLAIIIGTIFILMIVAAIACRAIEDMGIDVVIADTIATAKGIIYLSFNRQMKGRNIIIKLEHRYRNVWACRDWYFNDCWLKRDNRKAWESWRSGKELTVNKVCVNQEVYSYETVTWEVFIEKWHGKDHGTRWGQFLFDLLMGHVKWRGINGVSNKMGR